MPSNVGELVTPLEVLHRHGRGSGSEVAAGSDEKFDQLYPDWVQELSEMFWTPMAVALRSAELLVAKPGDRILDVGSGVGKFCFIGAATTAGVFHGIEQRSELVEVAQEVQRAHPWTETSVEFRVGNMSEEAWDQYQGIYLFNPFFEQTSGPWCQIDNSIGYSRETQERYVQTAVEKLASTRAGTRVATYFGFGSKMPAGFRKTSYEQFDKGPLELWLKEG